jgi:hypothetical protein
MLDKTAHNLEGLSPGCPSLIKSEPVQPLQDSLDLILSEKFFDEFSCGGLSESIESTSRDSLNRPCLTCFVARASVDRISTIIFMTTLVIAAVRGIFV